MYPIFSNEMYIFQLSSSCESLRVKKIHRGRFGNRVVETRVCKRVPREKLRKSSLRECSKARRIGGDSEPFKGGVIYDVFRLIKCTEGGIRGIGFKLVPKDGKNPDQILYFEFEKKEW